VSVQLLLVDYLLLCTFAVLFHINFTSVVISYKMYLVCFKLDLNIGL